MESSTLTEQGIDAFKAGNKAEAIRLLSDAIRANRDDQEAWLYLGAALDDPDRKRQAFQHVLGLDPDNQRAKNALARLDAAEGGAGARSGSASSGAGSAAASKMGAQANATMGAARTRFNEAWSGKTQYRTPGEIEGAPEHLTVPLMLEIAQTRIKQAISIYTKQDFEQVVAAGQTATMWDAVSTAAVGIVAIGIADFVGHLLGWPLSLFRGGLGGLIWIFIAPILLMASTAGGYYVGIHASKMYLENQGVKVPMAQHSMYYAMILLPLLLVSALFYFVSNALGFLVLCASPFLFLLSLITAVYGFWLLKNAFDRVYGSDNNRGLITAGITIAGWIVGYIIVGLVGSIFGTILRAVFNVGFTV